MTATMTTNETTGTLLLRTFQSGDEAPFKHLNEAWISATFALEEADHLVLDDPKGQILAKGGEIFLAELDGRVVGCCALYPIGDREYELVKMTVAEEARGHGVGRKLLVFAIDYARTVGTKRLYLESNKKAAPAVHLYEEVGFQHLAAQDHASKYARADVFMEMLF